MVNTLTLAHGEDPDGIISHVFLESQEHIFARYDRIGEAFQQAADSDTEEILVADINVNPSLISASGKDFGILEKLAERRKIIWFDHHTGTLEHKAKLEELGIKVNFDEKKCASLIVADYLSLKDHYLLKLAQIAQANDFKHTSKDYENIEIGNELEKIISLANESMNEDLLLELTNYLREGLVFNKRWKLRPSWNYYTGEFDRREKEAYKELDESVSIVTLLESKQRALFGYSSSLLSAKPGAFHLREKYKDDADIFICLFKPPVRNHIALINESSKFPIVPFVQGLGGGGRGTGGGFTLDYDITSENYEMVKGMLIEELRKYG